MIEDDRLERLLQAALPPLADAPSPPDLWPAVVGRCERRFAWTWLDLGLAALVAAVLLLFPDWLWLLAYHL